MAKSTPPSMLARASYRWVTGTRSVHVASAIGRRFVHVRPTPPATPDEDAFAATSTTPSTTSDAKFEVLGSPYSLLSVSLSPSQNLYTRRGTLVALSGKPESTVSTLSVLPPLTRALLRIPFLYQKISSTTPATALISTKSPISSFTVVHLDGRLDWIIAQRNALLAWTGHALGIRPRINTKLGIAHWGQMQVTGRGLVALVAKGQIYQVHVKPGEEYVAHPSNVVAYSLTSIPPLPYRFKSSLYRFQVPSMSLGALVPKIKFFQDVSESQAWKAVARTFFQARTLARRTIWGDRLFLRFQGPTTILLQSRAGRLSDSLSSRDIDEIADTPTGAVPEAVKANFKKELGFDYTVDVKVPQTPVGQPIKVVTKPVVQPVRGSSSSPSGEATSSSP